MKSKFAKFVDNSVGAILIFFAATAVFKYYLPLYTSVFCAFSVTVCAYVMLGIVGKKRSSAIRLSKAAEEMFFNFMFCDENSPSRALYKALKAVDENTVMHGNGVYLNKCAAFCYFNAPLDAQKTARIISRAKHYGAKKATVFCKSPPVAVLDIDGIKFDVVYGDDVYKLFASLGALPKKRFHNKKKSRFAAFRGAVGKDKIFRYLMLCVTLVITSMWTGHSIISLVCAGACAVLCIASVITAAAKARASRKNRN